LKDRKKILIISSTNVEHEPRVIRQYKSLLGAGFHVLVAGFNNENNSNLFNDNFIPLNNLRKPIRKLTKDIKQAIGLIKKSCLTFILIQESYKRVREKLITKICSLWFNVKRFHRSNNLDRYFLDLYTNYGGLQSKDLHDILVQAAERNGIEEFDFIISHDYQTSFVGNSLSRSFNSISVIDFHEHPISQYAWSRAWKHQFNLVSAVINNILTNADKFIFVSEGIRQLMVIDFNIDYSDTFVVRSLPNHQSIEKLNLNIADISIVYVGNICANRGLENAIQMMKFLPSHYNLYLQGFGENSFVSSLKKLSTLISCEDRVHFIEPVTFSSIIDSISNYDFGYFVCDNFGPQRDLALPNKIFQYIMAGLCVITSNFKETGTLVRQYDCGVVVDDERPENMAKTILGIQRDQLSKYKENAALARIELCWEKEEEKLLEIFKE
jgi:glycogen(starch) synthase